MKTTEYTGTSAGMRQETPWLASEDIMEPGSVEVTIERCYHHVGAEFDEGRKEDVYALAFRGKTKQLVLNATNRKTIVAALGVDVRKWVGATCTLYVHGPFRAFGRMTHGIRIKDVRLDSDGSRESVRRS